MIYFASDFHLGLDARLSSAEREMQIVRWLDQISSDATVVCIVGDIFDFWFEYKYVVPKGYFRFLTKVADLTAQGIEVHFFLGNHDMWMFDYFKKELGVQIHSDHILRSFGGKTFFIGHGDGYGPGDYTYKVIKKIFRNRICQFLFGWLHPNLGIPLASMLSKKSRQSSKEEYRYLGDDKEWLFQYAQSELEKNPEIDYFIFGHRHLCISRSINEKSTYVNLGEWLYNNSYARFNGQELEILFFEHPDGQVFGAE